VEDVLVAIKNLVEKEKIQEDEVSYALKAYKISEIRYREGLTDYIAVLAADKTLLNARNSLLQTRLNRLNAIAGLYKSLGGGW
jgi:outer membrane protein, multidrug efflux system